LTGLGYALAVGAARLARLMPSRLAPADSKSWNPLGYRLHVRNAFRRVRQPGLRELADDWNRLHSLDEASPGSTSGGVQQRTFTEHAVDQSGQRREQPADAIADPRGETARKD
jgi:hypothetical protein